MTTFKVPNLSTYSPFDRKQQNDRLPGYTLKWRQRQLLVSLRQHSLQPYLPPLESEQWLVECLKHSPVRLIRIDPNIDEASLKFWASACEQASKPVFLRISPAPKLPSKRSPRWWLKRLIEWSAAALLLVVLSPVMLGLVCLMRVDSPEPIFLQQWCVGERGKLFRLLKFRALLVNGRDDRSITPLGRWMRNYMDQLPQLFNVLRGEMTLVGPRPWALYDAVRISPEGRQELNALPGIIQALQSEARANLLDVDAISST